MVVLPSVSTFTALAASLAINSPTERARPHRRTFDQVIAFGDSYLDNGNGSYTLTNKTWPADPAYFEGRFSNGPTWVEYVARKVAPHSTLADHAFGGATINNTLAAGATGYNSSIPVPSVLDQVHSYLGTLRDHIGDRTLFVVDGGGNDAFFGPASGIPLRQLGHEAAHSLLAALARLSRKGAKHFLVPRSPDLSHSPYGRTNLNDTSRAELDAFAKAFSHTLTSHWVEALNPGSKITFVDQSSILAADGDYAHLFRNTTAACLTGVYPDVDDGKRTLCKQPDTYLYWDAYHPTTAGHKLLAHQAVKALGLS